MFHTSSIKASFQKLGKSTGSGRSSSPKLLEKLSSSFGRRSPKPAALPLTAATIPPPPTSSHSPEIAAPFPFEGQPDDLEEELLVFLAAVGTGDNPAAFQDHCELSIEQEMEAVKTLSQIMTTQQHQAAPPMASESTAMVEDRPRSAIRPIPRRARAAASVPAPSRFAFNNIPDYRKEITHSRHTTPPPDAKIEFMQGAELRHERNLMETKDLIERERAKNAGQSMSTHLFMPDLYNRLEAGTREATDIMKERHSLSPAQGSKASPPATAPALPGALPSPTSPQTKLAEDGDLAAVAGDLGREAALAAFAAMRKEKENTKYSTRIAKTHTAIFQLSEDRSTSGIFKSSNPISTRPKVVPMDEDKAKVEDMKVADAAVDSAPGEVQVPAPADMDLGSTAVESSEPALVDIATSGTIEAIVMAEPTLAVEDVAVPVMDLEAPVTITVVEPEPSYFPSSSPLFDFADIYAGYDFPAPPEDIFDFDFPEAQFGGDLPSWESFTGLPPPVPSPTPAAAPSADDDDAMLVDDEWDMDGVWPSGVAEPYSYSEFDIVVDTPADMAAAERDRVAWLKEWRASQPVVDAIETDEEEIPGLNLPPPSVFRCSSFQWLNLDLGLPAYSPPSPSSSSDSSDSGPSTPKDAYDPYDPDEIALYGGFDDGLTKVSPLFEDPFSTEKVDNYLEYLLGDMDLGGSPSPGSLVDRKSDVKASTQKRYSPYAARRRPAAADFF